MGTLAQDLIQSAYREGNLIPAGKQPTSDEQTEALQRLNVFVNSVFGFEMGENFFDWLVPVPQRTAPVAARWPQGPLASPLNLGPSKFVWPYPPTNTRIIFGGVEATVYFPENPDDGARMALIQGSGAGDGIQYGSVLTLDGNGRTIEGDDTVTYTTPVVGRQWLYRADLANWQACVDMELTDECPFPEEFDDFWICALAKRLAPRYGKITAAETQETAQLTLQRLKARYRQKAIVTYGSENFRAQTSHT